MQKKGWRTLVDFSEDLNNKIKKHNKSHLHGVIILEKGWFLYQKVHLDKENRFVCFQDNSLLRFVNTVLRRIQSLPMYKASLDRYHLSGFCNGDDEYDPEFSGYSGDIEPFYSFDSDGVF